jgi:hypothetical protein
MRAYAEETNRLNRERRASGDACRAELGKVEKQIQGIVEAIKGGMFQKSMIAAMDVLEVRKAELTALFADAPADTPDILPSVSQLYAKKVSHLTEALSRPEDRAEAAQALRRLIERIVLRPGARERPNRCHAPWRVRYHPQLNCGTRQGEGSTNEKSRSRGYGSVGIDGCEDAQPPIPTFAERLCLK